MEDSQTAGWFKKIRKGSLKGVTGYVRELNWVYSNKFNMSQMNPKEVFHNTAHSVQLPYIAGHSH